MKKNKLTKLALALGTVATIVAPVAAVVSCGSGEDLSGSVVIKTTWAATGDQVKALEKVVDYYNKNVVKKGDFKVVIRHVEGGYGDAVTNDIKDMKLGNMGPVADLVIDYPDSLGKLGAKSLDFTSESTNKAKWEGKFDKPQYLTEEVEGATAANAVYSLPLSKSTEMLTVDVPFLATLVRAGFIIFNNVSTSGSALELKNKVEAYGKETTNKDEMDVILNSLPNKTLPASASAVTIDDDFLNNYNKLFTKSSVLAQNLGLTAKGDIHIVGDDSPTNLIYQLTNKAGDTDNKFLYELKNGEADYSTLLGGATLSPELKKLNTAINNGALVLNGGGSYSSTDMVIHRLPFIIGSTAGYSHDYAGQSAWGIQPATGDKFTPGKYDKFITAPSAAVKAKHAIAMTDDSYHNPIFASTYKGVLGSYDIKLANPAADTSAASALKAEAAVLKGSETTYEVDSTTDPDKALLPADTTKYPGSIALTNGKYHNPVFPSTISGAPTDHGIKLPNTDADDLVYAALPASVPAAKTGTAPAAPAPATKKMVVLQKVYTSNAFVFGAKIAIQPGKDTGHVNLDEMFNMHAPYKSDSSQTVNQLLDQGPSFIGIAHGGKKDEQTRKFVNWFFNSTSTVEVNGAVTTPVSLFDRLAQYITPVKGAFDKANESLYTGGNKIAFEAYSGLGDTGIPFTNPVTQRSSKIRKSLEATIKSIYTDAHTSDPDGDGALLDIALKELKTILN